MAIEAVFGSRLAWYSEIEPAAIRLLRNHWPAAPNIGDVTAVNWSAVPRVDIFAAGYPCQPFSLAGQRKGIDDRRHIWPYLAEGIRALRPRVIVLENVSGHRSKGFGVVLGDLAALGYRVAWGSVRASDVGAAHRRERVFILAADAGHGDLSEWARRARRPVWQRSAERGEPARGRAVPGGMDWREFGPAIARWERGLGRPAPRPFILGPRGGPKVSPEFGEWLMGLPAGHITDAPGLTVTDQLKLIGNGVVPQQAEYAIRSLLVVLRAAD